jgi:hypothetical protein
MQEIPIMSASALVERVKAARQVQTLVTRFKQAGPMVLGPRGLEKPVGTGLTLQEGAAYWMGASSSPQMVVLTDVGDKKVKYKTYPFTGSAKEIERWIAADLLARGSATHLRQYGSYMDPELKRSLESLLRGGKGRRENLDDYRPVTMTLAPADDQKGQDLWRAAEEYGGVGGEEQDDGTMWYIVDAQNRAVEEVKNDPRFKLIKVVNRSSAD